MIESVQIRQRGAFDFETHYDNLCAMQDTCPLPAVKAHLSQGVLDLNGDRIRANDWQPVLNTLRINKSLEFVAIRSYYQPPTDENDKKALIEKRRTPSVRSKEITYRLCKTLKECLSVTPALTCLELQGLPLRERDLNTLMKGLVKNKTVNHFSLEFCRIGDAGLDIICKGIKNSTSINSVNFTGCSLSGKGAESLAKVIRHQAMRRHNEAWRDSLRYRRPDLDRMPGIRRITINNNPMLADDGATSLAEALKDDLWLKALDMQGCGISTAGAQSLLDVLKYNTTLVVLDVRRNPLIDRDIVHSIMEQLMINCNGQDTEYKWIKAEESVDPAAKTRLMSAKKRRTKTLNSSFGRKTTIRITAGAARRRTRSAGAVGVSRKMQPISSEGVKAGPGLPWRTAARANRYRGYPPEHIPGKSSLLEQSEGSPMSSPNQSTSVVIMKGDSEDEEGEDTLHELAKMKLDDSALSTEVKAHRSLKIELIQLRRQMQEERINRAKLDQRIVELTMSNKKLRDENDRLKRNRGSILDDDSVLDSIEASFKQFHEFLDLLRDAGLGQLITMAGLDKQGSPFQQGPYNSKSSKQMSDQMKFTKPSSMKSNGYYGDISSSNRVSNVSYEDEFQARLQSALNGGNIRPKSYLSAHDPTMKPSYLDDSHDDSMKRKHDDLYDRILHETSGVFGHMGEADVTVNTTAETGQTAETSFDDRKPEFKEKPRRQEKKSERRSPVSEMDTTDKTPATSTEEFGRVLKGHGHGEIIRSLSPLETESKEETTERDTAIPVEPKARDGRKMAREEDDFRTDTPDRRPISRISDVNYSMDSFEQSYFSERGEVVHLGDDLEYPSSPSPPPQVVSEEEDF